MQAPWYGIHMTNTQTLIPGPTEFPYIPMNWVMERVAQCTFERNTYLTGYYRNAFGVSLNGTVLGTVASFNDGSGWHVVSTVVGGPNGTHLSKTTRTRKEAAAYLVATAAGVRWH